MPLLFVLVLCVCVCFVLSFNFTAAVAYAVAVWRCAPLSGDGAPPKATAGVEICLGGRRRNVALSNFRQERSPDGQLQISLIWCYRTCQVRDSKARKMVVGNGGPNILVQALSEIFIVIPPYYGFTGSGGVLGVRARSVELPADPGAKAVQRRPAHVGTRPYFVGDGAVPLGLLRRPAAYRGAGSRSLQASHVLS